MAEEEGKVIQWPSGADEATDFDFLMVGKDDKPIMKIPKEKLNEVIVINGEGVKAVAGGATSATPTILRPGPNGQNRKMEDVQGWFVNGTSAEPPVATGTAWEAPAGKKNTNWWDGTTWTLGSSVPLPQPSGVPVLNPGGSLVPNEKAVSDYVAPLFSLTTDIEYGTAQESDKSKNRRGIINSNGNYSSNSDNWCCTGLEPCKGNTTYTSSGHSDFSTSNAVVCFYDENQAVIPGSIVFGSGQKKYTYTSPVNAKFRAHTIANASGIGIVNPPINNPIDNAFANSFMVNEGSEALPLAPYTGGMSIVKRIDGTKIENAPYVAPKTLFYKFDLSAKKFIVYSKLPKSINEFIGIEITRETDMSELVYKDLWRITNAYMYRYENDIMTQLQVRAMTSGESEFVYRTNGKVDFTGGFHGDEKIIDFSFFADGILVPATASIPLTECKSFRYVQNTNMHQTAASPSPGTVDPNHTVECEHLKETLISNGGYITHNTLKWKQNLLIPTAYHAISCIGKDMGQLIYNEKGESVLVNGNDQYKLEVIGNREYISKHLGKRYSVNANSFISTPIGYDAEAVMFIWDRPFPPNPSDADNKYYRRVSNKNVIVDDIWDFTMSVMFDKL
ncbi:hypothetical protein [Sphingobacterium sp. BIGb0116]|uniref:hypothetical protein n=1 Tax=Sphingobacterium sp. BIGb0116 TaxID=2940619 RepID=UPI0021695EF8|nr:hypothetical protein [Sphingobacterium sp. BIGb0116]MCS4164471.1 hypothetical protein [Sphingobacterium sp. BIGb0116]